MTNTTMLNGHVAQDCPQRIDVSIGSGEPDWLHGRCTDTQLLLTDRQTAARLAIGRSKVWKLIAAGELETVHVGRSLRVVAQSVADYVGRLRTTVD